MFYFEIIWTSGAKEVIKGRNVAVAFIQAGYGFGKEHLVASHRQLSQEEVRRMERQNDLDIYKWELENTPMRLVAKYPPKGDGVKYRIWKDFVAAG